MDWDGIQVGTMVGIAAGIMGGTMVGMVATSRQFDVAGDGNSSL